MTTKEEEIKATAYSVTLELRRHAMWGKIMAEEKKENSNG